MVRNAPISVSEIKLPEVEYNISSFEVWAMRLSRQGYGDILTIKNLDIKTFFNLIHYEQHLDEYQRVVRKLNKKS